MRKMYVIYLHTYVCVRSNSLAIPETWLMSAENSPQWPGNWRWIIILQLNSMLRIVPTYPFSPSLRSHTRNRGISYLFACDTNTENIYHIMLWIPPLPLPTGRSMQSMRNLLDTCDDDIARWLIEYFHYTWVKLPPELGSKLKIMADGIWRCE